jgi:MFS superfamily sulfate permease-like transporter
MSAAAAMSGSTVPQGGGAYPSILGEVRSMSSNILLVGLVLISAYESRIPEQWLAYFRSRLVQGVGLVAIFLITANYGWVHGILAALAYALVVSHAIRTAKPTSGFQDYTPAVVFSNGIDTTLVPQDNRWFVEKVLGENPYLIRERDVRTTAIQDDSERSMTASRSNK